MLTPPYVSMSSAEVAMISCLTDSPNRNQCSLTVIKICCSVSDYICNVRKKVMAKLILIEFKTFLIILTSFFKFIYKFICSRLICFFYHNNIGIAKEMDDSHWSSTVIILIHCHPSDSGWNGGWIKSSPSVGSVCLRQFCHTDCYDSFIADKLWLLSRFQS